MYDWIRPSARLISALYLFIFPAMRSRVSAPYRGILMRFELHAVTWIPIKSRFFPVGRLAGRARRGSSPGCSCWNNSLCLCECCDLVSQTPPVIDSELLGCWCSVTERLRHLGTRPAVRRLRRFLVKSSCARGRAWLTIDFGSHPWKDTVTVRFRVGILVSFNLIS